MRRSGLKPQYEHQVANLQTAFAGLQRDLEQSLRAQMRWMFGFWLATLVPLASLIIALER